MPLATQSGNKVGKLFLSSTSVAHAAAVLVALNLAAPLFAVTVTVDVNNVRATLPLEGLGMGTAVYANQFANSQLDERLNEAGVTTLRYSGGGYADIYHWSEHKDSPFGGTNDRGYVAPATTFPGLLNIMNNMNTGSGTGQAVITVNYGSALKLNAAGSNTLAPDFGGQKEEAAAWVAYANFDSTKYGTVNDVSLGIDQQGNNWRTAGYWAKLRDSTAAEYLTWATADGVYNSHHNFLAINYDATHAAPPGIKYWEIGNETFGTGYYGGGNGYSTDYHVLYNGTNRDDHPDLSPAHYGDQVVAYAQLMKQVDPTIKIGTVLATPPDDYSWSYADLNDNGSKQSNEPYWNDEVLSHAASATDFVMVHWYPYAGETYTDQNGNSVHDYVDTNGNGVYNPELGEQVEPINHGTSLLAFPRQKINQMINGTTSGLDSGTNRGIKDSLTAYGIPNAEIMVTEFNYFGQVWSGSDAYTPFVNYRTPAQALFVADSYASWLETGVTSVQFLELSKDEFLGDQGSLTRGPAFYAIQMLNYMADPGDEAVNSASSSNNVRVHSVLQDDGTVAVMVLNMNETTVSLDISINGDPLAEDGILYSTAGAGITTTPMSGLGNTFNIASMPGRTNYLFVIPLAPAPPPFFGDFNGDDVVDAADYTVWRNNLGTSFDLGGNGDENGGSVGFVDEADYDLWRQHYGDVAPPGGGGLSNAVPEPSTILLGLVAAVTSLQICSRRALRRL